jgi:hypothetical protein
VAPHEGPSFYTNSISFYFLQVANFQNFPGPGHHPEGHRTNFFVMHHLLHIFHNGFVWYNNRLVAHAKQFDRLEPD